jgi:hypothetical protein
MRPTTLPLHWPLVASAQDAARLYRLGFLIPIGREFVLRGDRVIE